MSSTVDLLGMLREHWGYTSFRPRQERIVRAIVAGQDVAVIMPTGGGKSLCYQLPAVVLGGTSVVISPLIALMQDQAAQLADMGIPSAVLNSTLEPAEQSRVMRESIHGAYRLLYLSPERLMRGNTFDWLSNVPVSFFAIDEAHCISEWGHEFRPDYRQLGRLRDIFPDRPIAAFTASATRRVRRDIVHQLRLRDPQTCVASFHRPNLRYVVRECDTKSHAKLLMSALRAHEGASVIVYCPTIKQVEATAEMLNARGFAATTYHGQMPAGERQQNQELWMAEERPVLVGTIAFGLGINKPSVRAVIHLSLPKSLEQYYQESGRAGRDGEPADCLLLWRKQDTALLAHFIEEVKDPEERERSWQRYHVMRRFADSSTCRCRQICVHFGEIPQWKECGNCDICGKAPAWLDVRQEVGAVVPRRGAPANTPPAADSALLAHLKEWRRDLARTRNLPAYMILSDRTLIEICQAFPRSSGELLEISGIGEHKARLYGDQLLRAIDRFSQ